MTIDHFIHIYDSFPKLEFIKIQGVGEPLLNNDIFQMMEYSKKKGSHVTTYTNGSLLHLNNNSIKLINTGIDLIRISVDGGNKKTFESNRCNSNFHQIVKNITLISKLSKGWPVKIELWVVACPDNITELPQIIDIAKRAEIKTVYIQILPNTFEYNSEIKDKLHDIRLKNADHLNLYLERAIEYAQKNNIKINVFASKLYSQEKICHWPFDSMFISVEGYIVPCGTISDPCIIRLGNIFKQNILDIWESPDYQTFRNSHLDNVLYPPCKNCYSCENKKFVSELKVPWQRSSFPFT
jgi:pyrroloquinoline quinone biosynthesis protein E